MCTLTKHDVWCQLRDHQRTGGVQPPTWIYSTWKPNANLKPSTFKHDSSQDDNVHWSIYMFFSLTPPTKNTVQLRQKQSKTRLYWQAGTWRNTHVCSFISSCWIWCITTSKPSQKHHPNHFLINNCSTKLWVAKAYLKVSWLWVNQRSTEKSTVIPPSLFQTSNFSKMQKSREIT